MYKITNQLYYGGIEAAGDSTRLLEHGIEHVIQLTYESPEGGYPEYAQVHRFSMMDGPRNDKTVFLDAVSQTVELLEQDTHVLVHCSAGRSRSVCVAAASLCQVELIPFEDAFDRIRSNSPVNAHETLREHGRACCPQ